MKSLDLVDEKATLDSGQALARALSGGEVIYLVGQLGAGKTTFSRGVIQGLGHDGQVKSPTYTLVEPYEHTTPAIYHFDLYRLGDPEELVYLGVEDYFRSDACCLVEWPDKGLGVLPAADVLVELSVVGTARRLNLKAFTALGESVMNCFNEWV